MRKVFQSIGGVCGFLGNVAELPLDGRLEPKLARVTVHGENKLTMTEPAGPVCLHGPVAVICLNCCIRVPDPPIKLSHEPAQLVQLCGLASTSSLQVDPHEKHVSTDFFNSFNVSDLMRVG